MSLDVITTLINGILLAVGGFLAWQGVYSLINAKTEHKPDGGADAWWQIGLGAFCIVTSMGNFVGNALSSITVG